MDNAVGLQDTDVIYVDTNVEQIESLPDTAFHRAVDLEVVAADKDGQSIFDQCPEIATNLYEMRDRLRTYVHSLAVDHLWDRHRKAL